MFFSSLRKHPFLQAFEREGKGSLRRERLPRRLRRWGRFAFPPRETAPEAKSEEKRTFSQASFFPRGNDLGSGVDWIVPLENSLMRP